MHPSGGKVFWVEAIASAKALGQSVASLFEEQ